MGFIYRIVNKTDGKTYVGQTTEKYVETRWKDHFKSTSNCVYLYNALTKYGRDAFDFVVIKEDLDENLGELEDYYIKLYNCKVPNGYNLRDGGIGGGKHHEETKKKISEILSNGRARNNPVNRKPVSQYTMDDDFVKSYFSIMDAAKETGVGSNSIRSICTGERTSCKGFKWKFGGPQKEIILKKNQPKQHSQMKSVIQSKDGVDIKTYRSMGEASKEIGVSSKSISAACENQYRTCCGFNWRLEGDVSIHQETMYRKNLKKKVIKSKDGVDIKIFDSAKLAAQDIGISSSCMSQVCSRYYRMDGFCKGFNWRYD